MGAVVGAECCYEQDATFAQRLEDEDFQKRQAAEERRKALEAQHQQEEQQLRRQREQREFRMAQNRAFAKSASRGGQPPPHLINAMALASAESLPPSSDSDHYRIDLADQKPSYTRIATNHWVEEAGAVSKTRLVADDAFHRKLAV